MGFTTPHIDWQNIIRFPQIIIINHHQRGNHTDSNFIMPIVIISNTILSDEIEAVKYYQVLISLQQHTYMN